MVPKHRENPQLGQKKRIDLQNKTFGLWTVQEFAFADKNGKAMWMCVCKCGNRKLVNGQNLLNGVSTNCGCQGGGFRHGQSRSAEYMAYYGARRRCDDDPKARGYKDYAGRGIKFKFSSFEEFFAEVGPRPGPEYSVDRIDNNGNYEKGNLRWATDKQQMNNRRVKKIEEFSDEELIGEVTRRKLVLSTTQST